MDNTHQSFKHENVKSNEMRHSQTRISNVFVVLFLKR